jgi:hypothetical protein
MNENMATGRMQPAITPRAVVSSYLTFKAYYTEHIQKERKELVKRIQALRSCSAVGWLLARIHGTSEQGLHETCVQKRDEYNQICTHVTAHKTDYKEASLLFTLFVNTVFILHFA